MVKKVDAAYVRVWDMLVGAVAWDPDRQFASFEFEPSFLQKGLDLAPLRMPVAEGARASSIFSFPDLPRETFRGLPGMLADALPDRFGNRLIDVWLARQGRSPESFSPVERLCYTGKRAMGALEFEPVLNKAMEQSTLVEVEELVRLAREVAATRTKIKETLAPDPAESLLNILRVGTSAGGARPKVVVAINDDASEIRSGQVDAPEGFDHWILKLDGISDESLGDPAGYGRIEYAYHNMARAAGIEMTECRLLEENGRAH
ncbi:MAG: type II toxin-antitoxin system HipA family toxin, partial [Desulfobacterales bacterium]|nr:type II toxin-antitoxin system HipA family toxin [Desulfobacterales bacterium]